MTTDSRNDSVTAASGDTSKGAIAGPIALPVVVLLAILAATPFLFSIIPPLTDVPGHIGQFSVQTAHDGDILHRYFSFRWTLTLNLLSDLIVEAAHPLLGVVPTVWLLCALTPALTVAAIGWLARVANRAGAHALPWALLFVFNSSFLWGFLNFSLTQVLGLLAVAGWIAASGRPKLRAAAFLSATPVLLVGHSVAGMATVAMIVGYEAWSASLYRPSGWRIASLRSFAAVWPVAIAAVATLSIWAMVASGHDGATTWVATRKLVAVIHALQDQNKLFDIASVAAALVVGVAGWFWGARFRRGSMGIVAAATLILLASPSRISGSDEVDTRLGPLLGMVFFALQDWSPVSSGRRRMMVSSGFVLLGARFAVTIASFYGYAQSYRSELAALDYIRPGSRVMNFSLVQCDAWRSRRLEHLGNLATTYRRAWVNSHWSIAGIHLLDVTYRPSALYYNDPSQMVVPARCVAAAGPEPNYRRAQSVVDAVRAAPIGRVDYLWIVGTRLPAGYRDPRLDRIWTNGGSELYAVRNGA